MGDFLLTIYNWIVIAICLYVSGWLMFISPLLEIASCNNITGIMVVGVILKIIFALPVCKLLYAIGLVIGLKLFDVIGL